MMARWPHAFREQEGRAAFVQACQTVATQRRCNADASQRLPMLLAESVPCQA
jgi:hypothetical protein